MSTIVTSLVQAEGKQFEISVQKQQVARCYLYLEYDGQEKLLGHIVGFWVDPDKRNLGYGGEILRRVVESAIEAGCRTIVGNVPFGEEALRKMVEKADFVQKGEAFGRDLP